jgi:UDP-N-acetylmuramoyl-L-alanyl-D-glutamate--2,6-diaminopimelate ligase
LVGRHNVQNCLAASAAATALGVDLEEIVAGLTSVRCVPGRLHRVEAGRTDVTVLVDYAHTDDALANVLSALRPLAGQRLIVLFGCGGDRDRNKRPRMAGVVARYADRIVVTSDNPRTEDPKRIIDEILPGFAPGDMERVTVEPDRRKAITQAIKMAAPGDMVLLAGKGHETYQEIGRERIDFDDAAVAADVLNTLAHCDC